MLKLIEKLRDYFEAHGSGLPAAKEVVSAADEVLKDPATLVNLAEDGREDVKQLVIDFNDFKAGLGNLPRDISDLRDTVADIKKTAADVKTFLAEIKKGVADANAPTATPGTPTP